MVASIAKTSRPLTWLSAGTRAAFDRNASTSREDERPAGKLSFAIAISRANFIRRRRVAHQEWFTFKSCERDGRLRYCAVRADPAGAEDYCFAAVNGKVRPFNSTKPVIALSAESVPEKFHNETFPLALAVRFH